MNATDEIEAMLALISSKQFRCAVCDRNDDLTVVYLDGRTRGAGARYDGKIGVDSDTDTDYINVPTEILPVQTWVICGNFPDHPADAEVPDGVHVDNGNEYRWVWHNLTDDQVDWNTPWPEIQALRGLDPDA